MRIVWPFVVAVVVDVVLGGCAATGTRTARTLTPGDTEVSMTFAGGGLQESAGAKLEPYGSILPDIAVRRGLTHDVELGARVSLALLYHELDLKIRLYEGERLHFAVSPTIGHAFDIDNARGRGTIALGVLATYETTRKTALLTGMRGGPIVDLANDNELGYGAAGFVGVEIHGSAGFVRPCVEAMMLGDRGDRVLALGLAVQFGVHD